MALIKLLSVLTVASVVLSARIPQASSEDQDYLPAPDSAYESAQDSYQLHQFPTLSLELPREEPAQVPFYSPEPSTELKAPQFADITQPNFYQVPIPATDLIAPIETEWNPNNDPKFFYEVPAVLTKQELPTSAYPKKYNKAIHSKDKPFSLKPKQEITLQAIDEDAYNQRQKELHNVFLKLAKKENQKQIQAEKTQQAV